MFTSIDKALIAVIMGLLYLFTSFSGISTEFVRNIIETSIPLITPILVYFVPNRAR